MSRALPILSPSQHEHLDRCDLSWAYRYIAKLRGPEKASAQRGTAMHGKLETYLRDAALPSNVDDPHDVARVALAGLRYLPLPPGGPDSAVEHGFLFPLADDVQEQGKIDFYDPLRTSRDPQEDKPFTLSTGRHDDDRGDPIPLVLDHKSTTDLVWVKTPDQARTDTQGLLYSAFALFDCENRFGFRPSAVDFRWIYYRTSSTPKAVAVDYRYTRDAIEKGVVRYVDAARYAARLHAEHAAGVDPTKLNPNTAACGKYGGCEHGPRYLNVCPITATQRFKAAMTQNSPFGPPAAQFNGQPHAGAAPGLAAQMSTFAARAPSGFALPASPVAQAGGPFGAPPVFASPPVSAAPPVFSSPNPPESPPPTSSAFGPPPAAAPAGIDFSAFQAPAAPVHHVDPRLAECPSHIIETMRPAYLTYCEQKGLDHKTGQPIQTITQVTPGNYSVAQAPQSFEAAKALLVANPAMASTMPVIAAQMEPVKRPGRPRKTVDVQPSGDSDQSSQIVLTEAAIMQLIGFLQSLVSAKG